MSIRRSIGWCTRTINPIKGCRNACWATDEHPEGNCYAACMARRHMAPCERCHEFMDVHPHLEVLDQVRTWRKPQRLFCGSATDLWSEGVEQEWRDAIWECVRDTPQHTWIVLTKRPGSITEWDKLMRRNLVLGVSITSTCAPDATWTWLPREIADWPEPDKPKTCVSFEPIVVQRTINEPSDWQALAARATCADWWMIGPATGEVARQHRMWPGDITRAMVMMLDIAGCASHLSVYVKPEGVQYLPRYMDPREYQKLEDGTYADQWGGE